MAARGKTQRKSNQTKGNFQVNSNPSIMGSLIDADINKKMVQEMFNIVGFHVPKGNGNILRCFDERLYSCLKTEEERTKENEIMNKHECDILDPKEILERILPCDLRKILLAEDAFSQSQSWLQLIPSPFAANLPSFKDKASYYDLLLAAWENLYGNRRNSGHEEIIRLCQKEFHLILPDLR